VQPSLQWTSIKELIRFTPSMSLLFVPRIDTLHNSTHKTKSGKQALAPQTPNKQHLDRRKALQNRGDQLGARGPEYVFWRSSTWNVNLFKESLRK